MDGESVLQQYIELGLESNLALKQKGFQLDQSLAALKESRSLFLPSLSLDARYSVANGGRAFEIPVGDLVNPLNGGLNAVFDGIQASMLPIPVPDESFPTDIPNEEIFFLRSREHETKLRLTQAIINRPAAKGYKLSKQLTLVNDAAFRAFENELIFSIQQAYFQVLIALEVETNLKSAQELVSKNLDFINGLIKNQKLTVDKRYRIEAESAGIDAKLAEAQQNVANAKAYFNFLLNRPLETEIETSNWEILPEQDVFDYTSDRDRAFASRAEIEQVSIGRSIANQKVKLERSINNPNLFGIVDYGFQGTEYSFTADDDFLIASLVLRWNIFSGLKQSARVQSAKIEQLQLQTQELEVRQAINLELFQAHQSLIASKSALQAANARLKSARTNFDMTNKRYQLGKVILLEWIDARTNLTFSENEQTILRYQYLIRKAAYQKAIGQQ